MMYPPARSAALAQVRGGGELGPAWHAAARLGTKGVSAQDLVSCAEALAQLIESGAKLLFYHTILYYYTILLYCYTILLYYTAAGDQGRLGARRGVVRRGAGSAG